MNSKFQEYEQLEDELWIQESKQDEQIHIKRAKDILNYLNSIGVDKIETNNYWFHFEYKGLYVDFVNQTNRLCGEIQKPKRLMSQSEIKDFDIRFKYQEYGKLNKYYYHKYNFEGDHIKDIKSIIEIVDNKEKEIIEKIKGIKIELKK